MFYLAQHLFYQNTYLLEKEILKTNFIFVIFIFMILNLSCIL